MRLRARNGLASVALSCLLLVLLSGTAQAVTPQTFYQDFQHTGTVWLEKNGVEVCARYELTGKLGVRVASIHYWSGPWWENAFIYDPNINISLSQGSATLLEHGEPCPFGGLLPAYSKGINMNAKVFGIGRDCNINPALDVSWPASIGVSFSAECNTNVQKWVGKKTATSKSSEFRLSITGTSGVWQTRKYDITSGRKLCFGTEFYGEVNRPDTDAYSAAFIRRGKVCLPVDYWAGYR